MPRVKSNLKGNIASKSIKSNRKNQKPTEQIDIESHIQACNTAAAVFNDDGMNLNFQPESDISDTDLAALTETQSQVDANAELAEKFPAASYHLHVYPSAQKIPAKNIPLFSPTDTELTTDSILTILPPISVVNSGLGVGKGGAGRYKQSLLNKQQSTTLTKVQTLAKYGKVPAHINYATDNTTTVTITSSKSPRVVFPTASKAPRSNIIPTVPVAELATVLETVPAIVVSNNKSKRKVRTTVASTATKQLNQNKVQPIKLGGRIKSKPKKRVKVVSNSESESDGDNIQDAEVLIFDEQELTWVPTDKTNKVEKRKIIGRQDNVKDLDYNPSDSESENEELATTVPNSILPNLPFNRIVREITQEIKPDLRF
jgi:hypothetical protein